ncbi:MAG: AAA family ATPase [Dehalococcoidia bacterium]|nr:AAA family ATPase [Dehalococcoidia bacterium]
MKTGRYQIRSGTEAIETDVPDIAYYLEGKLRKQAKVAVIGKWKVAKSFFTIQMGMAIAAGAEFLGFKTTPANVLYVNFEISEEMFQQRVQDMHHRLEYDLSRFKYISITDLSLDLHTQELDDILKQSQAEGFPIEVLIIDPRWKAIARDANQDEVIRAFCVNLDKLIGEYKLTVIIVHHEGVSTGSDKAGKGSTYFDAWLDGWFKIKPLAGLRNIRELDIWSRDSERQSLVAEFDYPVHKVAPELIAEKKAKTEEAKQCIIKFLEGGDKPERDVRFHVFATGITEYAFWRARKELVEEGRITTYKAPGPGNRKMIRLVNGSAVTQVEQK